MNDIRGGKQPRTRKNEGVKPHTNIYTLTLLGQYQQDSEEWGKIGGGSNRRIELLIIRFVFSDDVLKSIHV